jgi:hypothetical protein
VDVAIDPGMWVMSAGYSSMETMKPIYTVHQGRRYRPEIPQRQRQRPSAAPAPPQFRDPYVPRNHDSSAANADVMLPGPRLRGRKSAVTSRPELCFNRRGSGGSDERAERTRLGYSRLDDLTPVIFVATGGMQTSYSAGNTASTPFFFSMTTTNFAGFVVLALRPTVCTSLGPS